MSLVTFAVRAASGNWKGWTVQLVRTRRNTLRHSFATPLLAAGYDIRTVQQTARAPGSADYDELHPRIEPMRRLAVAGYGRHALGKGRHRTAALAGPSAEPILGGVALLHMTPGDLRLSQSQRLPVTGT